MQALRSSYLISRWPSHRYRRSSRSHSLWAALSSGGLAVAVTTFYKTFLKNSCTWAERLPCHRISNQDYKWRHFASSSSLAKQRLAQSSNPSLEKRTLQGDTAHPSRPLSETGKKLKLPTKKTPPKAPPGCRLIPVSSRDGSKWSILAGKTAESNDVLSTVEGKPHETWMHVADVPGSHVVVRSAGENSMALPPKDVLETAAGIAVFYSKAKGSVAIVHITTCGKVGKKSGSPAGQVFLKSDFKKLKVRSLDPAQFRN